MDEDGKNNIKLEMSYYVTLNHFNVVPFHLCVCPICFILSFLVVLAFVVAVIVVRPNSLRLRFILTLPHAQHTHTPHSSLLIHVTVGPRSSLKKRMCVCVCDANSIMWAGKLWRWLGVDSIRKLIINDMGWMWDRIFCLHNWGSYHNHLYKVG